LPVLNTELSLLVPGFIGPCSASGFAARLMVFGGQGDVRVRDTLRLNMESAQIGLGLASFYARMNIPALACENDAPFCNESQLPFIEENLCSELAEGSNVLLI